MIYLDHNATTPLAPEVLDAMLPYLQGRHHNPSSPTRAARANRDAIEHARIQVAALLGLAAEDAHKFHFLSGGSEANNQVLWGQAQLGRPVLASATEHSSVLRTTQAIGKLGHPVHILPVHQNGQLDLAALENALASHSDQPSCSTCLSLQLANNESGILPDLAALHAALAEHPNVFLHHDAIQAVGKVLLSKTTLEHCHALSLSAHKLHGPKGIGALYLREPERLPALIHGGGQEQGRRSGTENTAAIVGFGKAAEMAQTELEKNIAHARKLRDQLEQDIQQAISGTRIIGADQPRLPNTSLMLLPPPNRGPGAHLDAATFALLCDEAGLEIATGSACGSAKLHTTSHTTSAAEGSQGKLHAASHVLTAMGYSENEARSAIRVSLARETTAQEIKDAIKTLTQVYQKIQQA